MSSDSTESPIIEEGLESPIDNFVFRQCPAEFKLKISAADEVPTWSKSLAPPKASLLQISHAKGIILFPHHEKGHLGYASIDKLAEKENFSVEILKFPADESLIVAMCLDSSEKFLFVAKASKKIYTIDLAANEIKKRPFVVETSDPLESPIVQCVCSEENELWVILENGDLLFFNFKDDGNFSSKAEKIEINEKFSCISQIKSGLLALGSKEEAKLLFVDLKEKELNFQTVNVPFEELNSGSKGISSINLISDNESVLFSCVPDNPETDDVPLLLLEDIFNGTNLKFSTYFDPCASRPPRKNQFYYLNSPFSTENLSDFVVVANFASPDIGICGRLAPEDIFQTFFIDNDEGLAQLPFVKGEMIFPVGLALDFSSKTFLENLNNPDAKKYPPAPILWILTDSGHLCPFSMLKTDETEPFEFMKTVPIVESFESDSNTSKVEVISSKNEKKETIFVAPVAPEIPKTPQTPSKVPLEQLASLQKSTEINPIATISTNSPFSFKPAPVEQKPMKPVMLPSEQVVKPVMLPSELPVKPAVSVLPVNPTVSSSEQPAKPSAESVKLAEPELVKKEEKMESINEGAYKNILLAEIASTHAAMQDDLFILKQLTLKNTLLLRQNCQKYFNSLELLESYAGTLEKLVSSSDKVFLGIKDKLDELKFDLNELLGRTKQIKSTWNRIKQDNKIDWDARVNILNSTTQELVERMERVKSFMSSPSEASKYHATLKSFVDSAQEKIQALMAHLSGLFISQNEDLSSGVYADFELLSLSSENLLDQLKVLSLGGSIESFTPAKNRIEIRNKSLLSAVKSRGARLSIPKKITPVIPKAVDSQKLKLSAEDESLISSFISSIKLTEDVPEFAETARIAQLSLNDEPVAAKVPESVKPKFEFKPLDTKPIESKPFEFKSIESKPVESKPLDNKPAESKLSSFSFKPNDSSTTETKPAMFSFKQEESKSSPFSFKSSETKSESKPKFESKLDESNPKSKPVFEFIAPTESKSSFEFKTVEKSESDKPATSESKPVELVKIAEDDTSKPVDSVKEPKSSPASAEIAPKIPSIFTVQSQMEKAKESPLVPSLDSLSFESASSEFKSEPAAVKPFPSIFGIKPSSEKESITAPINTTVDVKPVEPVSNIQSVETVQSVGTVKSTEPLGTVGTAAPSVGGFSFNFNPQPSETTIKSPVTAGLSFEQPKQPAFSFAPQSSTTSDSNSTAPFSITNKPTFSMTPATTNSPVFGAPSMPKPPASTNLAPAFGQTSFPSSGPTSGFAAFAANTASQNNSTFSSFASIGNNQSSSFSSSFSTPSGNTGLTFASFLPAEKDKQDQTSNKNNNNNNNNNPSSTFSFTGFRE